jgi:hypothetical protein
VRVLRKHALLLSFALAYLLVPCLFLGWWIIDLWAMSYDVPLPQFWAKLTLAVTTAFAWAAFAGLVVGGGARSRGRAAWLAHAALLPLWVFLLWSAWDLDWRGVYLAALAGMSWPVLSRVRASRALVVVSLVMLVGTAAYAAAPSVRLARYKRMLDSCSCCGYQQKAVHELYALGAVGEQVIEGYLRDAAKRRCERPWFQVWTGAVTEELQRCRMQSPRVTSS